MCIFKYVKNLLNYENILFIRINGSKSKYS